jgi:hypothetical protein
MSDICITSDIDMLLFNKDYITNDLFDKNSITILNSDAYDSNRPECVGIYSGPDRYAICYIVATGKIFNKVLNTNVSFNEYNERLLKLDKGFDTDEIYFGTLVNRSDVRVNKVKRGYTSNFHIPNRIERHNFIESGRHKLNLNGYINIDNYIDCHCARPYSTYKNEIDNLVKTILK